MQTRILFLTGALLTASLCPAIAQEATASGNLNTEATWTALRNLVNAANNQSKMATTTAVDARDRAINALTLAQRIEACGNRNMMYAPAATGADAKTGCKSIPSGSGKDCSFYEQKCSLKGCHSKLIYVDQKIGKTKSQEVPKIWKDKYVYIFNTDGTLGATYAGQCRDGTIQYFPILEAPPGGGQRDR